MITRFELYEVLVAVAESKNFRDAAATLGISQPAVSAKLRELESLHTFPLFHLEGKRKVLTHFGRALYQVAKEKIRNFSEGLENIGRLYGDPKNLDLKVGGRPEILSHVVPHLDFAGRIHVVPCNSNEALRKLQKHEIDIALSHTKLDSTEIIAKPVLASRAHFVIHKKLLKEKRLTPSLVKDTKFLTETPAILYHASGHILSDWLNKFKLEVSQINAKYIVEDWRMLQTLVEKEKGFAIIPSYIETGSDVARVDLPSNILQEYVYYALFEKSLLKTPAFKELFRFASLR